MLHHVVVKCVILPKFVSFSRFLCELSLVCSGFTNKFRNKVTIFMAQI
jgi:hypothetical protein